MVGTGSVNGSRRHALSEHADPVLRHLTDLAELGSVVGPALAPFSAAERLQDLVDAARQVFAAGACSIALLDESEQNLVFEAASGRGADRVRGTVIPIGSGLAGWVVSSGQTLEISEVADDPRFATSRSRPAMCPARCSPHRWRPATAQSGWSRSSTAVRATTRVSSTW